MKEIYDALWVPFVKTLKDAKIPDRRRIYALPYAHTAVQIAAGMCNIPRAPRKKKDAKA
jgi:hypothetical protein